MSPLLVFSHGAFLDVCFSSQSDLAYASSPVSFNLWMFLERHWVPDTVTALWDTDEQGRHRSPEGVCRLSTETCSFVAVGSCQCPKARWPRAFCSPQELGYRQQDLVRTGVPCPTSSCLQPCPLSAGKRPGPYQCLLSTHQALDWSGRSSGDPDASLGWVPQRDHPGGNAG